MNTVFSNIANARITDKPLNKVWMDLFMSANEILMATGYVSNDAVKELHKILEDSEHNQKIKLLVGMHYLEGFSRPQYNSLCELNYFLQDKQRGAVYVSPRVKFHGKMYSFKNQNETHGLIGSANLTCFWDNTERTYETMVHLNDVQTASKLHKNIDQVIQQLGVIINQVAKPTDFKEHNVHLENCLGVEKVNDSILEQLFSQISTYHFDLPVKTFPESSLNRFFAKGRKNKRGFYLPRPWYEAELIVSTKFLGAEGYPKQKEFTVITDDGWQFECNTTGQNGKNFSSKGDQTIFGKWVKGRLEAADCLRTGEPVTEETLNKYGNDHFEFRSTDNPDVWLLSFKGKN